MANQALVISADETELFLDKLVKHGEATDSLSFRRRNRLAAACAELVPSICGLLGFNQFEIAQALPVSRIVFQLFSLAVEKASSGDSSIAVETLNTSEPLELIRRIVVKIRRGAERLHRLAQNGHSYLTQFGYPVTVLKVRGREKRKTNSGLLFFELGLDFGDWQAADYEKTMLPKIFPELKTIKLLNTWLSEIADLEYELRISTQFLPWDVLQQEAGLTILEEEDEKGDTFWTPDTLIATMTATLVCGGANIMVGTDYHGRALFMGTILHPSHLNFLHSNLAAHSESFLSRGREKFAFYIQHLQPAPDQKAENHLMRMWESAMENLLRRTDDSAALPRDPLTWLERIHLEVTAKAISDRILRAGQPRRERKKQAEKIFEAMEENKSQSSLRRLLSKLNWQEAANDGCVEELVRRLDPEMILEFMPLLPHLFSCLFNFWCTSLGRKNWTPELRRQITDRLLSGASNLFWEECENADLDLLMKEFPEKTEQIVEKIEGKKTTQ